MATIENLGTACDTQGGTNHDDGGANQLKYRLLQFTTNMISTTAMKAKCETTKTRQG
jgi:hypothetical protein